MWRCLFFLVAMLAMNTPLMAQTTKPFKEPTVSELPAMELAGIAAYGSAEKKTFAKLWESWPANVDNQPGLSCTPCYGLVLILPTSDKDHQYMYLASGEVVDAAKAPKHLLRYSVPAGSYAIILIDGGVPEGLANLGPAIHYFYSEWLPKSDYENAAPFNIERYHSKNKTIELLFPIKKKP